MIARPPPALIAAAAVFLTVGYFQNSRPGWNVNSQFGLTLAIVEQGSLSIDAYHARPGTETEDKAYFGGRFYCDKSPVTPFLGVPALALHRMIFGGVGSEYSRARFITTWWTMGPLAGLLTWMTALMLARGGVPRSTAAAAAAVWFLSTPLLGYSILFFNYIPACAFAMGGFLVLQPMLGGEGGSRGPNDSARLLASGLLIGLAAWTLQTLALLAIILTVALLAARPPREWPRLWPWAVGGVLGMAGYAVYSMAVFGEITSPYRHEYHAKFRDPMARGLMGAGWPDPLILKLITVHPYRGLFILFPATLAALAGCIFALRRRALRPTALIALAFLAGLILYNSGYFMWWGGWTYAPRHLIPALPFLAAGLIPILARASTAKRSILAPILIAGALYCTAVNVLAVSLDPQPPTDLRRPPVLTEEILLEPGRVDSWPSPFFSLVRLALAGASDRNIGTRIGLRPPWSLLPLVLFWAAAFAMILLPARAAPQPAPDTN